GDVLAHRPEQFCRRADVSADGADIRFDDTQRDFHVNLPSAGFDRSPPLVESSPVDYTVSPLVTMSNTRLPKRQSSCCGSTKRGVGRLAIREFTDAGTRSAL